MRQKLRRRGIRILARKWIFWCYFFFFFFFATGSLLNKQTEADSITANENSIKSLAEKSDNFEVMNTGIGDVVAKETEEIGEKEMFATKEEEMAVF